MLYRRLTWNADRGFMWDCDFAQRSNAMIGEYRDHPAVAIEACPNHYRIDSDTEVRDVIDWVLRGPVSLEPVDGYYLGNVVKYTLRCTRKENFESDLRKAKHYIEMMLGEA